MRIRRYLAVGLGLALSGGLARAAATDGIDKEDNGLIARIHFMGTAQIAADANAVKLNEIMALPESAIMREEIIAKLATTPFRVMNRNSPARTNDHANLIRPLVEDILKSESYLEMSGQINTNAWPELTLAVKLDDARADVWRGNLATVLKDWTSMEVKDVQNEGYKGWELKKHHSPNVFRFIRAGDWVVFGWGQDELALQPAILKKIKDTKRPVAVEKNSWLNAWLDGPAFAAYDPLPFQLPKMHLNVEGRKNFLRPELKMRFAEPLGLKLEPWRIPTNAISGSVASIAMARGFGPLLSRVPAVSNLNAEPAPNQAFVWAIPDIPYLTCAAAPVKNSTNYLQKIAPGIVTLINSALSARRLTPTAQLTTNMSVTITGLPFLLPFLRATNEGSGDFLVGGIFAMPPHIESFPWESLAATIAPDNIVYYDWEMNGERLVQWRSLSQLYYMIAARTLPKQDSPAQNWLPAIKSKLDYCATVVTLTGPDELTLVRNAPIGLTGFELTWLAYWLDAPGFPIKDDLAMAAPTDVAPMRK